MEKKVTPMSLATKAVVQKVPAYDWKSQGTDTVKIGTSGTTGGFAQAPSDYWND